MEDTENLIQNETTPVDNFPAEISPKKKPKLTFLLTFVVLILVAVGVYYLLSQLKMITQPKPTDQTKEATNQGVTIEFTETRPANSVTLTFGSSQNETQIKLERAVSYEEDFLSLPSSSFDSRIITTQQLIENGAGGFKYYDVATDKYYIFQPGGHIEIRLVSETEINKLVGETISPSDPTAESSNKTICTKDFETLGNMQVAAVTCKQTFYSIPENNILLEEETINCYLPVSAKLYLAVEQTVKPIGDINMCESLNSLGYQNATIVND